MSGLADALLAVHPRLAAVAATRTDATTVADAFGGHVAALVNAPDLVRTWAWAHTLAREIAARSIVTVDPARLADGLASVVEADARTATGDRVGLAGALDALEHLAGTLDADIADALTGLANPDRHVLDDAIDAVTNAPFGLTVDVTLDAGTRARVTRDPDRSGNVIVELFAGAGGWAEGLAQLGAGDIGLEWDAAACRTRLRAGHATVNADVAATDTGVFRDARPWGLIASPPCQSFSQAGHRRGLGDLAAVCDAIDVVADGGDTDGLADRLADRRSALVVEIVRWARDLRPDWVAAEETPGAKPAFDRVAHALARLGYQTVTFRLNAADFGVGQQRRRQFLTGHRYRQPTEPAPTHDRDGAHGRDRWRSMFDVLGWGLTERPAPTLAARNHGGGPRWEGGSGARDALKADQRAGRWVVRRQSDGTVIDRDVRAAMGVGSCYGGMTAAEAGQLQGFRADYPWQGSPAEQGCQIGNAVAPPVAAAVLTDLIS